MSVAGFRMPKAWLDFPFIGLNKTRARVGNGEKIVQQISYTFDCPSESIKSEEDRFVSVLFTD